MPGEGTNILATFTLSLGGVEFCLTSNIHPVGIVDESTANSNINADGNNMMSISKMCNDEILIQLNNFVGSLQVKAHGIYDAGGSSKANCEADVAVTEKRALATASDTEGEDEPAEKKQKLNNHPNGSDIAVLKTKACAECPECQQTLTTLPEGWKPSTMTHLQLIETWFLGDVENNIPPLCTVKKLNIKNDYNFKYKMKNFIKVVEAHGREKGVWIDDPKDWEPVSVDRMWGAIKEDFLKKWCKRKKHKSKKILSWRSAYNKMEKARAFGTKYPKSSQRSKVRPKSESNALTETATETATKEYQQTKACNTVTVIATKEYQQTKTGLVFARRASIDPESTYISSIVKGSIFRKHGPSLVWSEVIFINGILVRSPRHAAELVTEAIGEVQLEVIKIKCESGQGGNSAGIGIQEQQNVDNLASSPFSPIHTGSASFQNDFFD